VRGLAVGCAAALLIVVLAAGAPGAAGQTPPPQAQQQTPPRFESRVEVGLVTADVTVVDRDGRPVTDLTTADFSVRVDGKPRTIASLQFVAQEAAPARPAPAAEDETPDLVSSNESVGVGRLITFVIDQSNIRVGGGRAALRTAERFLETLTPADRVAVFGVPPPGPRVPFTNDLDRVREALQRSAGQAPMSDFSQYRIGKGEAMDIVRGDQQTFQSVVARECTDAGDPMCPDTIELECQRIVADIRMRARASISSVESVLEQLGTIPGPKTVVLISEGLTTEQGVSDVSRIGELAAKAQVSLYALRLAVGSFDASEARRGPTSSLDQRLAIEGLETLAGVAKGAVFNVVGSGEGIFERVTREISGYYLLAFEPTDEDNDGKPHDIRVDVNRDGVTVRARREFRVTEEAAARAPDSEALAEALGTPLVRGDVPMRLTTYNFKDAGSSKVRLLISAEIGRDHQVAEERALAFALFDRQGRVLDSGMQHATLFPRDGANPSPFVYDGTLLVEPGDYVLKLAVVDNEGRVGTIEHNVHAALGEAGPIRTGDLVIGTRSRNARTLRLPTGARVAGRAFSFIELYADRDRDLSAATVTIEVSDSADGPALVSSLAPFTSVETEGQRQALAELDLGVLPPGPYVVRARILVGERQVGVIARPFAIEASAAPAPAAAPVAPGRPAAPAAGSGRSAVPYGVPMAALDAASLVDTFSRDPLFEPAAVGAFLDELVAALPPGAVPPALEAALVEARAGRLEAAADQAKGEVRHPLTTFLRGLNLLQKGDIEAAGSFFRSTLQAAPGAFSPMVYLAACYAAGGRDDEAAGAWQTSLLGLDDSPLVFQYLADAAMRSGNGAMAVESLQEALAAWPDDARFSRRLAAALLLFGRPEEGLETLDRHLEAHPDDERAWYMGVQAVFALRVSGRATGTPADDLARARRYADGYERLGGVNMALVRAWLAYLEKQVED